MDSGIAVFTGAEDRQAVTVAMTRGRDANHAYVITGWNIADSQARPGTGARSWPGRRASGAEWAGLDPDTATITEGTHKDATAEEILGRCLDNDGRELSATGTREAEWSDADRLDVLGYQWRHVQRQASQQRYEQALREALGAETARQVGQDPAATWLWRTLREAEAAGLDGPATLRRAVAWGPLDDAESVAKVLDWRIRQQTAGMPALAARPWTEQVPRHRRPGHRPVRPRTGARRWTTGPGASASTPPSTRPPGHTPSARCPITRWTAPNGSTRRRWSPPTGRCGATSTRTSRSAPGPAITRRRPAPCGRPPPKPSATCPARCASTPTGSCGPGVTPGTGRWPGPRSTRATSWPWCAGRSAAPRSTPTGPAATPRPPAPPRPGSG